MGMKNSNEAIKRRQKSVEHIILVLMLGLFLAEIVIAVRLTDFTQASKTVNLFLTLISLLFSILLYIFCIVGSTWNKKEKLCFVLMVILFFIFVMVTLLAASIAGRPELRELNKVLNTILYMFSGMYWLAFWVFQKGKYRHHRADKICEIAHYIFLTVYALVALVNHFTGFCFTIDEGGNFVMHSELLYLLTLLWFVIYFIIEEVRFPGLKVETDIQAEDFLLPTLTVQPLVENAVRHGISKRPDASDTVRINSEEGEDAYLISIIDNGVGFISSEHKDGKHIGIANAKARLHILCSGTLTIVSEPGWGTVCKIRIPKRSEAL